MVRRNFPDVTFQVVQRDRIWPIWLLVILGGALGVFAFTALIVSILISRLRFLRRKGDPGRIPAADRTRGQSDLLRI